MHRLERGERREVERRGGEVGCLRGELREDVHGEEITLDDDDLGSIGGLEGRSAVRFDQVGPDPALFRLFGVVGVTGTVEAGMTLTGESKVMGQDQMSLFHRQRGCMAVNIIVMSLGGRVKVDRDGLLLLLLLSLLMRVVCLDVDRESGQGGHEGDEGI